MQGASALFYTFFTRLYRTRVEEKIHKRYSLFYIQKNERNSCENEEKESLENICALFFAFCMVFSTVAGDASFVTAYAAEVQTAA